MTFCFFWFSANIAADAHRRRFAVCHSFPRSFLLFSKDSSFFCCLVSFRCVDNWHAHSSRPSLIGKISLFVRLIVRRFCFDFVGSSARVPLLAQLSDDSVSEMFDLLDASIAPSSTSSTSSSSSSSTSSSRTTPNEVYRRFLATPVTPSLFFTSLCSSTFCCRCRQIALQRTTLVAR